MERRASFRRLLILVVPVLLAGALFPPTGAASTPQLTLDVCRAHVTPCQREVSIPTQGTVDLDLVLTAGPDGGASPSQVVAWEGHWQFSQTSVASLISSVPSGRPVREQGEASLALEGRVPLEASGAAGSAQYFTVQNSYDPASGLLDYAVTLLRFDPSKPRHRALPFSGGPRWHLGRITVEGSAAGTSDISVVNNPATSPSQVVTLTPAGQLHAVSPSSSAGKAAIIKVGNVTTPELSGQVGQGPGADGLPAIPFPAELAISFWEAGAAPQWRGGSDAPVATFQKVTTDTRGAFRVTDIAPSLVPPGLYDLRVKGRGTLPRRVPDVRVPGSGGLGAAPAITPVIPGGLREGDVDGNNVIDRADFLALRSSFGMQDTHGGFNGDADFNADGVVDVLDFSRLAPNFGQRGE